MEATGQHISAAPIRILLVEDSLRDVEITRRALILGGIKVELSLVRDGAEAIDYLYRKGNFLVRSTRKRPDVILLDLNLPKIPGIEVLKRIRRSRGIRNIPVIVLTNSQREEEIRACYYLGARRCLQKPAVFNDFLVLAETIRACKNGGRRAHPGYP